MNAPLHHRVRQILRGQSFAAFGINEFCYVKHTRKRGRSLYTVHGADGTYLWCYTDRAIADAALRQQEIEPLSVH
jgi:hypothetical protein